MFIQPVARFLPQGIRAASPLGPERVPSPGCRKVPLTRDINFLSQEDNRGRSVLELADSEVTSVQNAQHS